jgi:hypothetical protein
MHGRKTFFQASIAWAVHPQEGPQMLRAAMVEHCVRSLLRKF